MRLVSTAVEGYQTCIHIIPSIRSYYPVIVNLHVYEREVLGLTNYFLQMFLSL
jgi:hypothetical protein